MVCQHSVTGLLLMIEHVPGTCFVNKMARLLAEASGTNLIHKGSCSIIAREISHRKRHEGEVNTVIAQKWQHAASCAIRTLRSGIHYLDHINVTAREHMSGVDCFDGKKVRRGNEPNGSSRPTCNHNDLPVIHPVIDGRLRDEGRTNT